MIRDCFTKPLRPEILLSYEKCLRDSPAWTWQMLMIEGRGRNLPVPLDDTPERAMLWEQLANSINELNRIRALKRLKFEHLNSPV
jgi:hypothetical protein